MQWLADAEDSSALKSSSCFSAIVSRHVQWRKKHSERSTRAAALHVHNELEEHGSTDEEMMSAKRPPA